MAYTTVDNPELYFQTKLYTGDGNSTQAITLDGSENMQPDLIWIKNRTDGHYHNLNDSVRGVGAAKVLRSNTNGAEGGTSGHVSVIGSDGFTVAAGTSDSEEVNTSSDNYVAWNWKAGGSASSNSDGDVTSSVSANTTAGFSIVKFTASSSSGAMTVGHGLGATPQVVIVKDIGAAGNWQVYFEGIGTANQQYLKLNDTAALANYSNLWGAGMTSSVIGIGVGDVVDASESDIAYCFAEKKGYSKFGTYTGNGSSDGTFVYTGFKPAMMIFKPTSTTGNWFILDNKRDTINPLTLSLFPNLSSAETGTYTSDFLSNGIKIRLSGNPNSSGVSYIYMAFAENPFVNSGGVPTTAR
jgi:hypothetical protein